MAPAGALTADVEGLALYKTEDDRGYLVASSQGNDTYIVYRRDGRNEFVGSFRIAPGEEIDGAEETDGIDICADELGDAFPRGLFIAQDGFNDNGNQNFKVVPWEDVAGAFEPPLALGGAIEAR